MQESFEEWNENPYVITYDLTRGNSSCQPWRFLDVSIGLCTYKPENIICLSFGGIIQRILSVKILTDSLIKKISISKICSLPGLACWYTFTMILMMRKDKKHIYLTLTRWPIPYAVPNLLVFPSVFWTLLQGAGKHSCICQKKFWMFWSHCQVVKFDHYHKNTQVCPFPLPQGEVRL